MCTKCSEWVHGKCAKIKRVTSTLANGFVCKQRILTLKGIVETDIEILFFDQLELVKSFCNLGQVNASCRSEAARLWR